jgi:NADH:ubiquinone oxidoreductase subunit K
VALIVGFLIGIIGFLHITSKKTHLGVICGFFLLYLGISLALFSIQSQSAEGSFFVLVLLVVAIVQSMVGLGIANRRHRYTGNNRVNDATR